MIQIDANVLVKLAKLNDEIYLTNNILSDLETKKAVIVHDLRMQLFSYVGKIVKFDYNVVASYCKHNVMPLLKKDPICYGKITALSDEDGLGFIIEIPRLTGSCDLCSVIHEQISVGIESLHLLEVVLDDIPEIFVRMASDGRFFRR